MIYVLGGGANLNFKVVGGTSQPSSPSENTIWVNTGTVISEWVFSAEEPENPVEGMIWFQTGASSAAAFNALKKNNITVYPTGCKQYVSGAWGNKTAKTYQGGAWVDWIFYLFNNGDQCTGVTGGWTSSGWTSSADAGISNTGTASAGTTLSLTGSADGSWQHCVIGTVNKINLSEIDTIKIKVDEFARSDAGNIQFGFAVLSGTNVSSPVASVGITATGEFSLNVSDVDTSCYLVLYMYGRYSETFTLNASVVWGE